jgi:ABC-type Fe3+ transport system permease subunit
VTLFNELFDSQTLHALSLTCRFSFAALFISWLLSLIFVFAKNPFLFSVFRFLWILPGFGFALITLSSLRFLGIEHRYGMFTVLLAWVLAGTPYLALAHQSAIRDLDLRQKEAIESLGAGPIRAFFHFEFLRTLPAQAHALLQQLWLYFTSFSLVMILSGGFPNETLEVGIYTSVRLDHVDLTHAWALGIWQFVFLVPLRLLLNRLPHMAPATEWSKLTIKTKQNTMKVLRGCGVILAAIAIVAAKGNLETAGLCESFLTSLALSLVIAFLCLAWVGFLYRFKLGMIAEIGAWISPMLLTLFWWKQFGFILAPFINAVLVQIILFSPWMARSLFPVLKRIRTLELEAAETLGCTPTQAWLRIEWPRIRGRVVFVFTLVISLSFAEVTAVLLFSENKFEPLAVWVQNAFLHFRMDEAMLGTILLVVISMTSMMLGREEA